MADTGIHETALIQTEVTPVELTPVEDRLIDKLLSSGLYGTTKSQVVERLIAERLSQLLKENGLKLI